MAENALFSTFSDLDVDFLTQASSPAWASCDTISIDRDWLGRPSMTLKGPGWLNLTRVSSLWNREHLCFRFECWFDELNLNLDSPHGQAVERLWETDVVEVFLRPESCEDYFEIELSPIGQWLDAHVREPRVDVDFHWSSELQLDSWINHAEKVWTAIVLLPFRPILQACCLRNEPAVGDAWRLNLFRMTGEGADREFLAWRPTFTPKPDFHVPSAFGTLLFLDWPGP